VALWLFGDGSSEATVATVIVRHFAGIALRQWRRSVRLASAVERLEKDSP
jgi:hypothetical protein